MYKLIQPMPSPRGTNHAGLFIAAQASPADAQGAYDAMPRFTRRARDEEENGESNGNMLKPETVVGICDLLAKAGMPTAEVDELRATL